jgi:copper chaperone
MKENPMSIQTFPVTGLTCGHCVGAITSELNALPDVTDVQIDLVGGGTSTLSVTADQTLTDAQVAAALDEAGEYQLATS